MEYASLVLVVNTTRSGETSMVAATASRVRKPKRRGLVAKGCARRERRQQTRRVVDSRGGGIREREIDERRARRAQPFDGAVQTIGSAITRHAGRRTWGQTLFLRIS